MSLKALYYTMIYVNCILKSVISCASGHMGSFYLLAIFNSAAMNVGQILPTALNFFPPNPSALNSGSSCFYLPHAEIPGLWTIPVYGRNSFGYIFICETVGSQGNSLFNF